MGEMTLYQISNALETAIEGGFVVDEETGEIYWSPDDLDALSVAFEKKLEGCAAIIAREEHTINGIQAEIKRLQALKSSYESKKKGLENYVMRNLERLDGKVALPTTTLSIRNTPKVEVLDMDAVPDKFKSITVTADKRAIRAAIKSGEEVEGACIVYTKSLQRR